MKCSICNTEMIKKGIGLWKCININCGNIEPLTEKCYFRGGCQETTIDGEIEDCIDIDNCKIRQKYDKQ